MVGEVHHAYRWGWGSAREMAELARSGGATRSDAELRGQWMSPAKGWVFPPGSWLKQKWLPSLNVGAISHWAFIVISHQQGYAIGQANAQLLGQLCMLCQQAEGVVSPLPYDSEGKPLKVEEPELSASLGRSWSKVPWAEPENQFEYKGQWLGSQCHGKGVLTRPDGSSYEGHFQSGACHAFT
eukprot:Skav215742  [mRNA]  locus=scaffold106:5910:10019:- [translate_table: standard]